MTILRITIVFMVLALVMAGCGSHRSTYRRTTAPPDELVWGYDDGLHVRRGGQRIELGDLAPEIECVPTARAHADSADGSAIASNWLLGIGLGTLVGGAAVGSYLLIDDSDANLVSGLGIIGGGLITGLIMVAVAGGQRTSVLPDRLDAVNVYNDRFAQECQRATRRP